MLKHTFFMTLSTAFRLLTGVVLFIIMARVWGPDKFGSFMYLFTVTSLVALVVDYGFSQQLMREIGHAQDRTANLISGVMSAKFLLAAIMVFMAAVISLTPWGQTQELLLMWILLITCLAGSFAETFNAVFRGLGQYHEETSIAAWVNVLHFTLVAALLAMGVGVTGVATGFLISRILFLFLAWRTYLRLVVDKHHKNYFQFSEGINNIKSGLPFAAETAFTNFQSQADTLIVNYFLGSAAVGVYQAGLRLMQGANTFAQVLSNVYLPSMAGKANDKPGLTKLASRLYLQMFLIGTFCFLLFAVGAEFITHMLYGAKYDSLVSLMPWFGFLLLLRYAAASHGVTLSAMGQQSSRVYAIASALVVLFASSYFLIPRFGLSGMLYASVMAVICLYMVYASTLVVRQIPLGINKLNAVLLTATLSIAILMIKDL